MQPPRRTHAGGGDSPALPGSRAVDPWLQLLLCRSRSSCVPREGTLLLPAQHLLQAGRVLPVPPTLLPACSHEFLLPRIVEVEQDNKMTSSNLGIVFGPTLMRPRPTDATISLSSLVDYPHQARIIEALIIFYSTIFENKETTVLADSSKYATDSKEEAASCSDLVGVSGEGSTLRGCGADQDSLLVLATWSRSAGADPPAAPTPPTPLLNGASPVLCPADCSSDLPHPCCATRWYGSGQRRCPSLTKLTLLHHVPTCIPTPLASDFLPQKNSLSK